MDKAVVVGLGTMGGGIAQVLLQAGYGVTGVEDAAAHAEAGRARVQAGLDKAVEKGKLAGADAQQMASRFSVATDVAVACAGATLVVEAISEDLAAKQALLRTVEGAVAPETLLGSNTSSLSITAMASALKHPQRLVGMHFFNPVPVMGLVEVVRGERTTDATVARTLELVAALHKEPIVVQDSPGFATSRLGIILGLEAMRMLEEGVASAADIDKAMELGYRHPMGPLKLTDLVGLDVRLAIAEHLWREVGEQFRPPKILRRLVRAGKLGKKSGSGFYTYG